MCFRDRNSHDEGSSGESLHVIVTIIIAERNEGGCFETTSLQSRATDSDGTILAALMKRLSRDKSRSPQVLQPRSGSCKLCWPFPKRKHHRKYMSVSIHRSIPETSAEIGSGYGPTDLDLDHRIRLAIAVWTDVNRWIRLASRLDRIL
jgi:hypothetical protein